MAFRTQDIVAELGEARVRDEILYADHGARALAQPGRRALFAIPAGGFLHELGILFRVVAVR